MTTRYYGTSIGGIDFIEEITDQNAQWLNFVHETSKISIMYVAAGHYSVSGFLPLQLQHKEKQHIGQVLVRPHNSAVCWHVATIHHWLLFEMTRSILEAENRLLLYFERRTPISDYAEFEARLAEYRAKRGIVPPAPLTRQHDSIMSRLPKLCSACGEESDQLLNVPDEKAGVCEPCFQVHYTRCVDCERVIPRADARYDGERILCVHCHDWGKSMGFI